MSVIIQTKRLDLIPLCPAVLRDLFDAQLTTVLVARLALELVEELTQSASKKSELRKDYEDLMSEAKRLDAQEQSGQDFAESAWVNARL